MTKEAQRLAIATACGWNSQPEPATEEVKAIWGFVADKPKWWYVHQLPDFASDLNAMFEAEKILDENQQDTYWCQLRHLVDCGMDELQHCFNTVHATAEQRARAFLFALGKWVEP